jgi:hypothetical protein
MPGTLCNKPVNKLQGFFSCKLLQKKKVKDIRKTPTGVYNNGRKWLTRMLHLSGIEHSTLQCGVCVARRQY